MYTVYINTLLLAVTQLLATHALPPLTMLSSSLLALLLLLPLQPLLFSM